MSKKYRVVRDLQGGEFGMGRDYTAEEWLEQAVDWRDSDDSWGDYGEGVDCYGNRHKDSRSWFVKFWKRMIKDGKEQKLIDYIADIWQIEFEEVKDMTLDEIAEELYDELQHNRIVNCEEYDKRLYELLDLAYPNEERVGDYVGDVENIMHNKWSFGFCEMCGDVIFYNEDSWYDLWGAFYDEEEQELIDKRLPEYEKEVGHEIQDVCPTCFNKIVTERS